MSVNYYYLMLKLTYLTIQYNTIQYNTIQYNTIWKKYQKIIWLHIYIDYNLKEWYTVSINWSLSIDVYDN